MVERGHVAAGALIIVFGTALAVSRPDSVHSAAPARKSARGNGYPLFLPLELRDRSGRLLVFLGAGEKESEIAAVLERLGPPAGLPRSITFVNALENRRLALRYGVRRTPLLVFIDGRGYEQARLAGTENLGARLEAVAAFLRGGGLPEESRLGAASPHTLSLAGDACWEAGETKRALRFYLAFLESPTPDPQAPEAPAYWRARRRAATTLMEWGRLDAARSLLERTPLGELPPGEGAWTLVRLAMIERERGRADRALDLLERHAPLLRRREVDPEVLYTAAALLAAAGKETEAALHLAELAASHPATPHAERARRVLADWGLDCAPPPVPHRKP